MGISNVGSEMVGGERSTAEIGWCMLIFTLNQETYETRDQHMLKRLQAGCALRGLCHVTAHDWIILKIQH